MKVIISGGSRGIGRAIAHRMAEAGHELVLIARSMEDLQAVEEELPDTIQLQLIAHDLSKEDSIPLRLAENEKIVLINNAGQFAPDTAADLDLSVLEDMLQLNLKAAIRLTQTVLPFMQKAKQGHIINIGSIAAINPMQGISSYRMSKAALKSWTDDLRTELRSARIKVSGIYPGAVLTSSWEGEVAEKEKMIPAPDIADLCLQLISLNELTLVEELIVSPLNFQH
jgi:short-subunit dehydrogenase